MPSYKNIPENNLNLDSRIIKINETIHFVAKDTCTALDLENTAKTTNTLDTDKLV